jgi:hypothetical protein
MSILDRRLFILGGGAAAGAALLPVKAFASSCSPHVRNSNLGEHLLRETASILYAGKKASDLMGSVNSSFWKAEEIEAAITQAWTNLRACPKAGGVINDIIADHRAGRVGQYQEFIGTKRASDAESFPRAIDKVISHYLPRALDERGAGRSYKAMEDMGLQAAVLNARAHREGGGDITGYLSAAGTAMRQAYTEGFNRFITNTLTAQLAADPVGTGAPKLKFD